MAKNKTNNPHVSAEDVKRIAAVKAAFSDAVTDLIRQDIAERTERMAAVHALTDAYLDSTAETAPDTQLNRLSDYILKEEITTTYRGKSLCVEYPFLSDRQLTTRRNGEVGVKVAEEYATDGRNYSVPKRRKRSAYENQFVDQHAKSRNRERAAQYRKDTAAGELVTYNLRDTGGALSDEFTGCKEAAEAWKERLSFVY